MILAALLVLGALGLFVAGIATGATAFYWACVALCVVAAVLLGRVWWQARRAGVPAGDAVAAGSIHTPREEPAEPRQPVRPVEPEATDPGGQASRHRSRDESESVPDGVVAPDQGEPAGKVSGATAAGAAEEPPGDPALPPPAADAPRREVPLDDSGEPPVEEVEVTDLLLVVDLHDEVLVVDEHPRYHLAGCPWLAERTTIPLPIDEARTDGFTPCGECTPDRSLAETERTRRAEGRSS